MTRSRIATSPRRCAARKSGASSSPSRARVRTSPPAKTKAVRDGDDWIVNGQKVWTTGAQFSDFGILLVRTNPDVEKHKGLTMFIVDMKQPRASTCGRSTRCRAGATSTKCISPTCAFRIKNRLGEPGQGWGVALVTLMNERLAVGGSLRARLQGDLRVRARASTSPTGEGALHQGRSLPPEARRLDRARRGLQAREIPHHDGALERPDARTGKLDRQSDQRQPDDGHRQHRDRSAGSLRHHQRSPISRRSKARSTRATCSRRACASPAAPMRF